MLQEILMLKKQVIKCKNSGCAEVCICKHQQHILNDIFIILDPNEQIAYCPYFVFVWAFVTLIMNWIFMAVSICSCCCMALACRGLAAALTHPHIFLFAYLFLGRGKL